MSTPARVQLFAVDGDGNKVALLCDEDGKLVLAAGITIDPGTIALNASVDGLETLVTSSNTKLDTLNTSIGANTTAQATAAAQASLLAALQQPTKTTAVTKSDSTDITTTATKGLWVGTGGDLAVKATGDSSATTLLAVPSGTYIPGAYARVMAATTASNIISFA